MADHAIILASPQLFGIAHTAYDRSRTIADDALVAILFSAAALEGFVNEVAELARIHSDGLSPDAVTALAALLAEAERFNGQVALKIQIYSSILTGVPFDRGGRLYQDFELLFKLRNSLAHLRPESVRTAQSADGFNYEPHTIVRTLTSRGIISPPSMDLPRAWTELIATPDVARWAFNSAVAMARALVDQIEGPFQLKLLFATRHLRLLPPV